MLCRRLVSMSSVMRGMSPAAFAQVFSGPVTVSMRHASTRQRQASTSFHAPPSAQKHDPVEQVSGSESVMTDEMRDVNMKRVPSFMKDYSTLDLVRYTLLSFVTSNRILLPLATKLMPYIPVPLVRFFVCPIYCGGETAEEVCATGRKLLRRGIGNMMLSYAVEDANGTMKGDALANAVTQIKNSIPQIFVKHNHDADHMYKSGAVATAPASGYIALKPTGLMEGSASILANFDKPEYAEKWQKYLDVCRSICQYADKVGEGKVVIVFDAEKTWLQNGVYAAQRQMMKEFNHNNKVVVCGTIQMYLQGSVDLVKHEIALAETEGYQVAFKLVRGAYMYSEPNRWEVIHKTKSDTDASFDEGCKIMVDNLLSQWKAPTPGGAAVSRLLVCSHNVRSCEIVADRLKLEAPVNFDASANESVVFGQLMGMNEDQSADLAARGLKVVKYVPWGPSKETKEYLTRRLEENGDAARGGWEHFVSGCREIGNRALSRVGLARS